MRYPGAPKQLTSEEFAALLPRDHVSEAVAHHQETLQAQAAMQEAASRRDTAVRAAVASGVRPAEIGRQMGLSPQRINTIIHK